MIPDLFAVVALDLDMSSTRLAARATGPFEFTGEILEEGRVSGQAFDDRHRLSLSARLLDAKPSRDSIRHGFVHLGGASAALFRPTAFRAHSTPVGGVDGPWFPARTHNHQLTCRILSCHPSWTRKRSQVSIRRSLHENWEYT